MWGWLWDVIGQFFRKKIIVGTITKKIISPRTKPLFCGHHQNLNPILK
ncbi:hypothetical protein LEP1GSC041_2993 [Leptospira noguchii str. 2006001870]|nr:hypothetical protein LEP1GSC041_2993 [Leptospira noguchii str. 2006001870]